MGSVVHREVSMSAVRRIARPLLAATFVSGGLDAYRHPAQRAKVAAPVIAKLPPQLGLPNDPELLVRMNGAAMAGAGALLSLGRLPRLAALVLSITIVPTTLAGHRFWEVKDPAARKQQQLHFTKNLGLLGGVLLAVVDTEGRPGLSWRARRANKDLHRTAAMARKEAKHARRTAKREARLAAHSVTSALPFD
jgi:putative oxidoreductase